MVGSSTTYSCDDDGLDAAIQDVNNNGTITFDDDCDYIAFEGGWNFSNNFNFEGNGVVLDHQDNDFEFFTINSGSTSSFSNMTFRGANQSVFANLEGGAMENFGTLYLINVTFADNSLTANTPATSSGSRDADGGALYNEGTLYVFNSTFSNNRARASRAGSAADIGKARGAAIYNAGDALIVNSLFYDNLAFSGNGGVLADGDDSRGGAIRNSGSGTMTVINSTFYNNEVDGANDGSGRGGAISNNGTLSVYNSIFRDNKASDGSGDDLHNESGSPQILSHSFYESNANTWIETNNYEDVDPLFTDAVNNDFSLNFYSPAIGVADEAIYLNTVPSEATLGFDVDGDGTLSTDPIGIDVVSNARFDGLLDIGSHEQATCTNAYAFPYTLSNSADYAGELVRAMECANRLPESSFEETLVNPAPDAVITIPDGATVTFTDDYFNTGNATPLITGNLQIVANNSATIARADNGINYRLFETEENSYLWMSGLRLTGASNPSGGGGAISNNGFFYLSNAEVENNTASNGAGVNNKRTGVAYIINSIIRNNAADASNVGGGVFNDNGALEIANTLIYGNTAEFGAGIYNSGDLTVVNSTVAGNEASAGGGGISNIRPIELYNSIFAENTAPVGADIESSDSITADYLISTLTLSGTGNIMYNGTDPLFTDVANDDYSLPIDSIALNAGNDATYNGNVFPEFVYFYDIDRDGSLSASPPAADVVGNNRFISTVDVGAHENICGQYALPYTLSNSSDYATELSEAITCANLSNQDGTISLGGDVSVASAFNGDTAFPNIETDLVIDGNGYTIERAYTTCDTGDSDPDFRLLNVVNTGSLALYDMTLQNGCIDGEGGAIYSDANLTLANVVVQNNATTTLSTGDTGGIRLNRGTGRIANSIFRDNVSNGGEGNGAFLCRDSGSNVTIMNTLFEGNSSIGTGGGALTVWCNLRLINSTITGNTATTGAGFRVISGGTATLNNSIVINNTATSGNNILNAGTLNLDYSLYEDVSGSINANTSSTLYNGTDPVFVSSNDYRLADNSIALGAGNNFSYTDFALSESQLGFDVDGDGSISGSDVDVDLAGADRFFGTIDQGAYEGDFCSSYVFTNGYTLSDSAISYTDDLVRAMECANETQTTATIIIPDGAYIGFEDDIINSNTATPEVVMDLTIYADGHATFDRVASEQFRFFRVDAVGSLTLANVTMTNAYADSNLEGGVILSEGGANLTIINSTFSNNRATDEGGVIKVLNNGTLTVVNSTFNDNIAENGGAIDINSGTLTIVNSLFYDNQATSLNRRGGAIETSASGVIINSTFTDNTARVGGGVYTPGGTLGIYNSILVNNIATEDGLGDDIYKSNNTVIIEDIIYNEIDGFRDFTDNGGNTVLGAFDPLFLNAPQDDFSIVGTSDAYDAADLQLYIDNVPTEVDLGFDVDGDGTISNSVIGVDVVGASRLVGLLDIGAHENQTGVDSMSPTIVSITPADNNKQASQTDDFVIVFDEVMQANAGNITIYNAADNSVFETIAAVDATIVNETVTINPVNDLLAGTAYYVQIDGNAFMDASGNFFTGITTINEWSFSTENVTLYVDADATGNADGSSWADAYPTLQDAMANALPGYEIWVAAGIYYVDEGGNASNDNRSSTYTLLDGMVIYGGFAGTETDPDQRDIYANRSILSGDLNQNGGVSNNDAYHVVAVPSGVSAILDGVTIRHGFANSSGSENGYLRGTGGGIINLGTLIVRNSIVEDNAALFGAGIANDGGSLTVLNSTVSDNEGFFGAGGVYSDDGSANMTLVNVTVSGNQTSNGGNAGGVYSEGTTTIINSTIINNSAEGSGGGIYRQNGTLSIANSIVSGNTGTTADCQGAITSLGGNIFGQSGDSGNCTLNTSATAPDQTPTGAVNTVVDTTLAYNGGATLSHALVFGSIALDAGDDAQLPVDTFDVDNDGDDNEILDIDQLGNVRILNNRVDSGTIESNGCPQYTFPVTVTTEADLTTAIHCANANSTADTITLGSAITLTAINSDGAGLPAIRTDVTIDGSGFGITRSVGAQDDFRILNISSGGFLTLQDITLSGGTGGNGGAIYVEGGELSLLRTSITDNAATNGGALYLVNEAFVTMVSSTLSDNSVTGSGGALYIASNDDAIVTVNSTIANNNSGSFGGGISSSGLVVTLNTTIVGNGAASDGGGLYLMGGSVEFYNTLVTGNTASINANCGGLTSTYTMFNSLLGHSSDAGGCSLSNAINSLIPSTSLSAIVAVDRNGHPLLANNGGNIETIALVSGSPALNIGDNSFLIGESGLGDDLDEDGAVDDPIDVDQRGTGFERIGQGLVDAGAYEGQTLPGDCNADGIFDAGDVAALNIELSSPASFDPIGCDADGNGAVTAADLVCTRALVFDPTAVCSIP